MLEDTITKLKATNAQPRELADVFIAIPANQDTWMRLDAEAPEVRQCYWEQINPYRVSHDDKIQFRFAVERLLDVRRSPAVAETNCIRSISSRNSDKDA